MRMLSLLDTSRTARPRGNGAPNLISRAAPILYKIHLFVAILNVLYNAERPHKVADDGNDGCPKVYCKQPT